MYALMAAAVGSLLGIVVGWAMVRIMAAAFAGVSDGAFELVYFFNWRSLLIAYLLTTAVAWQSELFSLYMFGTSLLFISIALLAWRLGVPERLPFTLGGVVLLYWWLAPKPEFIEALMPAAGGAGIEMFFLSGIMVVIGAVWTTIYNVDLLTRFLVLLFGNVRGLASVLCTAVAYSMNNRFRTGMTLAMFSLVIFTLVVMAFIINAMAVAYGASLLTALLAVRQAAHVEPAEALRYE
jgi:hypothetical protein